MLGATGDVIGVVTDDYGLAVGGIRYESPDSAAQAATEGAVNDGWQFWSAKTELGSATLAELLAGAAAE